MREKLMKGIRAPIVVMANNVVDAAPDANDFLSTGRALKGVSALAIVADTDVNIIAKTFLIILNQKKAPFPTELFADKYAAHRWLDKLKF